MDVAAAIFDLDANECYVSSKTLTLGESDVQLGVVMPPLSALGGLCPPSTRSGPQTFIMQVLLTPSNGLSAVTTTYWLPEAWDVLDYSQSTWYYTPVSTYANFSALATLPAVNLTLQTGLWVEERQATGQTLRSTQATVLNPTSSLAFFIRVKLLDATTSALVLPAFYSDNYFTLLPGEEQTVAISYNPADVPANHSVTVDYELWNNISGAPASAST